jgi:hypothetical protein
MKLKGKTRPPANTGEPLPTLFQGGQGEDLDAVQVLEDGLVLHTNTLQKRRRYRRVELMYGRLQDARRFGQVLYLVIRGDSREGRGVGCVALSDENTAEMLRRLILGGARAFGADLEENAREAALGDLRDRAEEARRIYGEDTEVSVRKITVPSYDPASRREHIVGRFPIREGEPLRLDVDFVLSEIRRRYLSVSDYERVMGKRPTFRAYWNLSAEGEGGEADGVAGGYAELGYRPEDDTLLIKLHNGFEDELSPTTEDYASELLREAAGRTVYIESAS